MFECVYRLKVLNFGSHSKSVFEFHKRLIFVSLELCPCPGVCITGKYIF
jgi:hypothetical protein